MVVCANDPESDLEADRRPTPEADPEADAEADPEADPEAGPFTRIYLDDTPASKLPAGSLPHTVGAGRTGENYNPLA